MQYRVRLFDAAASMVREQIAEGASRETIEASFAPSGLIVLSADAVAPGWIGGRFRVGPNARFDVAWWCRELRALLAAGMTVVEALETLEAQDAGSGQGSTQGALLAHLQRGSSLSEAMRVTPGFPSVLISGIRAAERTSALVPALTEYLRFHEMLERMRKQVVSAAIYPAVVVALGSAIGLFLLLFVIPRFSRMYGDLRGTLSWPTQVLLAASRALANHGVLVAASLAIVVVAAAYLWRRGYVTSLAAAAAEHVTAIRDQVDQFRLAKLYQSLALMFRGGYSIDDSLGQCIGLHLGHRFDSAIASARAAISRGQGVGQAFSEAALTDPVTHRLLRVAERAGDFDRILQTIAERHAANFNTFVERATRIVEPLLLMLVALVVGAIVVLMYMPVFDMASSIR